MFHELCRTGRAIELDSIHRFHEPWEAAASLQLRHGDPRGVDAYIDHGRVAAGSFDDHLRRIAKTWLDTTGQARSIAITASTNEHVDKINGVIQYLRTATDQISSAGGTASIGGGETAYFGDVVVTRQNDRRLQTSVGEPVRSRESWIVEAIGDDGSLTVSSNAGSGFVTLPAEYTREHVRLGYAATEHGNQGDTVDLAIELATVATTHRGLYVGATRGRDDNKILVVTDTDELDEAREILRYVLTSDRSDVPAVTQRRLLAEMERSAAQDRLRLTPRCSIPPWFADLRSEVARRLAVANDEVDDERRQLEDVHARIAEAKLDLIEAKRAMEPFRPAIDQAREDVEHSQQEMWSAHAVERRAGRLKRPAVRRAAKQADEALVVAQERLADARAAAAPVQERVDRAWAVINSGESSISTLRTLHDWNGNETRRDHLVELNRALATWSKWALGQPFQNDDLHRALQAMVADRDDELRQPFAHLVDAVAADRSLPSLVYQPAAESRDLRPGLGLEL